MEMVKFMINLLIGKGFSDVQNHDFEQNQVVKGVLSMKCHISFQFIR